MSDNRQVWQIYNKAKNFGRLPSELMGVDDHPYLAWCFDEIVNAFGLIAESLDKEQEKVGKTRTRKKYRTLGKMLREARKRMTPRARNPLASRMIMEGITDLVI